MDVDWGRFIGFFVGVPFTIAIVWLIYVGMGLLIDLEMTKEVFLKMKKKEKKYECDLPNKNIFQGMGNDAIEVQMAKSLLNRGVDGAKEILDLAKEEGALSDVQYVRLLLLVRNNGVIPKGINEEGYDRDLPIPIPQWARNEPKKYARYIACLQEYQQQEENKNAGH